MSNQDEVSRPADPGRLRQTEIFVTGVGGVRPRVPAAPAELERRALRTMSRRCGAYMVGSAGAERTAAANREAFDRVRLAPRVLRDVSRRDLSVELFGRRHAAPFLLAPIGVLELAHRDADLAVARAAAREGIGFVFSSQASVAMEECAAAMGDAPRWFQLYWSSDMEVVRSLVSRAEKCGCEAIVLTVDTTLLGWRPRDLDLGSLPFLRGMGLAQYLTDPVFRAHMPDRPSETGLKPKGAGIVLALADLAMRARRFGLSLTQMRAAVGHFVATYSRPDMTWDDLARLRETTRLPILIKGLRHPEDARLARDNGVDGIVLSNHGGRQVDGEAATLDLLPAVVEAAEGLPVLFDSGIRTGSDIAKALGLGARAVLVGRPYAYGLAIDGEEGVCAVIRNLRAEFDLTLALCGVSSPGELDRSCLLP